MSSSVTFPPFFFLASLPNDWEENERERTGRMPKMVATGTRIGISPSLFSSGCPWFVSWHPHCSAEWCYNILTISRSGNVNSPLGYLYKIINGISSPGWNKDQHIIKFHCGPTSYAFLFPSFSFGSTHTHFFFSCPEASSFFFFWNVERVTIAFTSYSATSASDMVLGKIYAFRNHFWYIVH